MQKSLILEQLITSNEIKAYQTAYFSFYQWWAGVDRVSEVRLYKMANIMKGWVKQVLYLPAWGTFIACSECNNQPVCYSEFRGRKKRSYYSCRKGVTSIDVSRRLTILVTGCLDATVRLWNLFLMDSPIGILRYV